MEWLGVDRRRLGTAMLAFGLVGLVLAVVVAGALVAGAYTARDLDTQIVAAQNQAGASLTRLTLTMDSVADSIDHASTTLGTSRDGVVQATDVLGQLADTTKSLASALDISVFGQQPFTATVAKLNELEGKIRAFQDDATKLAANLDQNTSDVKTISGEVRDMRSQVAELAGAVTSFARTREVVSLAVGGIALGALLTIWQAILAAAIAWMGWRLRRVAKAPARADVRTASIAKGLSAADPLEPLAKDDTPQA
jgi:uncharacterized protein YoxC